MKISVVIPAFNEEKNIAKVIKTVKKYNNFDELIVVDNNSTDRTREIAISLGVKTISCKKQGKGYAMEVGLKEAIGDVIVFIDGDICNYRNGFINDLVEPIVKYKADFVKSSFEREGGRVTELVAKPLIELTFPKLSKYKQPLSGIIAGKKKLFKKILFEKDYGVDVGILIDMYLLKVRIKQVDIGSIKNDSQNWKDLIIMAKQVATAIIKRVNISAIQSLKTLKNVNYNKKRVQ